MSEITIDQAIEVAARDLPDGYVIEVNVESGSAWVEMYGPDGSDINLLDQADLSISEQIREVVTWALFLADD